MVKKILETFKTDIELEAYLQAQQQSLIEVSKKINELQQENENLKKQSENLSAEKNSERTLYLKDQEYTDAEIICVNQLERLRILAEERQLTYEETKKTETLTKVLEQVRSGKKDKDDLVKDLPTEEILRVISGGGSEN